jgi:hypothetical protein
VDGQSLSVHLGETAFVDEVLDEGAGGVTKQSNELDVPVGDVGLDLSEHLNGGLVDSHKCSVVELSQTEQLQRLPDLRREACHTTISDCGTL